MGFLKLLLPLVTAITDRVRGGWLWSKTMNNWMRAFRLLLKLTYGTFIALALGLLDWTILLAGILMWVGEKPGWGQPIGDYLEDRTPVKTGRETWQVLGLWDKPLLSLFVRGLIWGLPVALLGVLHMEYYIFPAITGIAMLLAAILAKHFNFARMKILGMDNDWGELEGLRGFLVSLLALLIFYFNYFWNIFPF